MKIRYLLVVLFIVALLLIAGCKENGPATGTAQKTGAAATPAEAAKPAASLSGKVGNVPLETKDKLMNIKCGDGICTNREYMSSTKKFTCRSLLDSCSVDVDDKPMGTENYFICAKDCSADCNLDVSIDLCRKSDDVYQISIDDRKGNIYNYLVLYRAERVPFMDYGYGSKGKFIHDLSAIAPVIGSMKSIEVMPRFRNSDGTITDCSNNLKIVTDISPC